MDLKSLVFENGTRFFTTAPRESETRSATYLSGSRQAQKLNFKSSDQGDLRKYLSCYDTNVGGRCEGSSLICTNWEIGLSLGVNVLAEVLFLTDILP